MRGTGRTVKVAAVLTTSIIAGVALRQVRRLRPALADVAPALRSPLLPFLTGQVSARVLRLYRAGMGVTMSAGAGVTVRRAEVPSAVPPALVVAPREMSGPAPAILHIHGGGMIMGSPGFELPLSGQWCRDLGVVVVSPDYRLAPEHSYPAAVDDVMETLYWMRAESAALGIDPDRIAVAGSSAGGGLAAAIAQRAFDEGIPLRGQVLVYPMLDDRTALDTSDRSAGYGRFVWNNRANLYAWTAYLGRPPRRSDAPGYAAPARRSDLSGLAPAWDGVGEIDLFHDETVSYAKSLRSNGVRCDLVVVPGMYHGADGIKRNNPAMLAFRQDSTEFLREVLQAGI